MTAAALAGAEVVNEEAAELEVAPEGAGRGSSGWDEAVRSGKRLGAAKETGAEIGETAPPPSATEAGRRHS